MSSAREQIDGRDYVAGYNPKFLAAVREKRAREEQERNRKAIVARIKAMPIEQDSHVKLYRLAYARKSTGALAGGKKPVETIIFETALKHGVTIADIKSRRKRADLVEARHDAIVRAYTERADLTLPQLGRLFNRDHTSILHAVQKAGAWRNPGRQGQ